MQCVLSPTTDAVLEKYDICTDVAADNAYATEPMRAVAPKIEITNEEEVYTAFEQALSDRQEALHEKLQRLSDPALHARQVTRPTRSTVSLRGLRKTVLCGAFALIFTLLGFDLMGLLLLYK